MAKSIDCVASLVYLTFALFVAQSFACSRYKDTHNVACPIPSDDKPFDEPENAKDSFYPCEVVCGARISLTLIINNELQEPYFNYTDTIENSFAKPLIYFMNEVADRNGYFRYTASYFNNELGYFINSFYQVAGSTENRTYWQILANGIPTTLGASSYRPSDGEVILFNFTTY